MQEIAPHLPLRFNIFQQSCYILEAITHIMQTQIHIHSRTAELQVQPFCYV